MWGLEWLLRRSPAAPMTAAPHMPDRPALADVLLQLAWVDPEQWAGILAPHIKRHAIDASARRLAGFLANTGHETAGGRRLVESLDYTPQRLGQMFGARATREALAACRQDGRAADQRAIANIVYGGEWGRRNLGNTRPGDGWAYRGRGLMQVTGRNNYVAMGMQVGMSLDLLSSTMEAREGAADTACRWWDAAGCNALADAGDLNALRRRVNGGLNGLAEVEARHRAALHALGVAP